MYPGGPCIPDYGIGFIKYADIFAFLILRIAQTESYSLVLYRPLVKFKHSSQKFQIFTFCATYAIRRRKYGRTV